MSPSRLTQRGSSQRLPVVLPGLGSQETDPSSRGHRGGAGHVVRNPTEAAYARSDLKIRTNSGTGL